MTARPVRAWEIQAEPGNGTHYRLVITEDPAGGLVVTWPDARWLAWAAPEVGGYVHTRAGKVGRLDLDQIRRLVDVARGAMLVR